MAGREWRAGESVDGQRNVQEANKDCLQWKKNVQDIEGEVLCGMSYGPVCDPGFLLRPVSQFTLYGNLKKGNKPDFHDASDATTARRLYEYFFQRLGEAYKAERVKDGVFQAMMEVELKNDGPVCQTTVCCGYCLYWYLAGIDANEG